MDFDVFFVILIGWMMMITLKIVMAKMIRGKIMRKIIRLIIINCMKIMKINIPTIINIIIISTRQK